MHGNGTQKTPQRTTTAVRLDNRGAHAWARVREEAEQGPLRYDEETVPRLLVHAVKDPPMKIYITAVKRAVDWMREHQLPVSPPEALDHSLAMFMDAM